MASTQFAGMASRPVSVKTEHFDMDSFFDFSHATAQPSPATASSSKLDGTPKTTNQDWSAVSPFDQQDERQYFNGPSHDYTQYKQQVGLPMGSMATIAPHGMYDGYSSGIGDMGFDSGYGGWSSGIDMDTEMNVDFNNPHSSMPAMFFPTQAHDSPVENFVNPGAIAGQEEPSSNVGKLWPGMHSQQAQQAAMQKQAQQMAVNQRQMKLQAQHAQFRQAGNGSPSQAPSQQQSHSHGKKPSQAPEPHVEESISRLLHQMRHNSSVSNDDDDDDQSGGMLPHIARMKKDEEEMDEDERLLASDEGKKLSSKERRQLRNKVSARAFRSRRKEYISQLEGEVAMKTQESNNLRSQNSALINENERYRMLIETLLRHPAFTPFINDLSKDPTLLDIPQQQPSRQHQSSVTPTPQPSQPQPQQQQQQAPQQESKPEFMNFDASQLQIPQPQQQTERVNLAMIPENDFSKLNINGFNSMNFNSFRSVNAFAVIDLPKGPDPVDLLIDSPVRLPRSSAASADFATTSPADSTPCNSDMTVLLAKLDSAASSLGYGNRCI